MKLKIPSLQNLRRLLAKCSTLVMLFMTAIVCQINAQNTPTIPPTPTAPRASLVFPFTSSTARLFWTAATGTTGYRLDLSTDRDFKTGNVLTDFAVTGATQHTESTLRGNTTYFFRVRSENASGTSASTLPVSFRTSTPTISIPSNNFHFRVCGGFLTAQVVSNSDWSIVEVSEGAVATRTDRDHIRVDISANPSAAREINVVLQTTTLPVARVTDHSTQEGIPLSLTATPGDASVTLSWVSFSCRGDVYQIFRSTNNGPRVLEATLSETTKTYISGNLTNGTPYIYFLRTLNNSGNASRFLSSGIVIPKSDSTTSVQGLEDASLAVYPNPVDGDKLTLRGKVPPGTYEAAIVNLYGKPLLKQQVSLESDDTASVVDVSTLPPGVYVLKLTNDKVTSTVRFEKKQ